MLSANVRWLLLAAPLALLVGCKGKEPPAVPGPCADSPNALAQAPSNGQLPCELLPPGFTK